MNGEQQPTKAMPHPRRSGGAGRRGGQRQGGDVPGPPPPEVTRGRWRRRIWWLVAIVLTVVLVIAGALVAVYVKLTGNVKHIEVTREDLSATRPPKAPTAAINVLVVGSDQRDGKNAKYGHRISGERTDTIMLAHLSPHRDNAMITPADGSRAGVVEPRRVAEPAWLLESPEIAAGDCGPPQAVSKEAASTMGAPVRRRATSPAFCSACSVTTGGHLGCET